ncbi:MAG: DUF4364 family protein [Eubacteriales bacterium]|nr:DUF4364 family protein [Eubacteriales bacterium]
MKIMGDGYLTSKTDVKIFILFLLDYINSPLEYSTINDIMIECGYIRSFDFAECFSELTELGLIIEDKPYEGAESYYIISEKGRLVAHELGDSILASIREKSAKTAAKILSLHERGARFDCHIEEVKNNKVLLTARMTDSDGKLFCFEIRLSGMTEAQKIKKNFEKKPDDIYRAFLSMASGDIDYFMN